MRHPRLLLVTPLVLLPACGGAEEPNEPVDVTVSDSAGVTIIDNGPLPPDDGGAPSVPRVAIGVVDGPPEDQMFRISDVKRLSDGSIAVTNGGTRELRIYEPDGTHRVTAGGEGNGPSEFRYPVGLTVLAGDTIEVQDRLDRVYFTAAGDFVRRETADRQALTEMAQAAGGMSEGGRWMADGTYFVPVYERSVGPPVAGPPFRPHMLIVRVSDDFGTADTLGAFGGILQQYVDVGRGRPSPTVPPYSRNTWWALGAADGTVVVADNDLPQIHRFHPGGSHSIVRWSAEAEAVSADDVEDWKDRQRGAPWTRDRLPELERGWSRMDIPETKPYYGPVTVGSDGTLWVASRSDPMTPTTFRVFSPNGRYEGTFVLPGRFAVYDSGPDWLLGVMRDENEVEFVQLHER